MTKKAKEVKSEEKLSLNSLKIGDKILDLHNEEIEITEDLIEQMKQYEKDTKKSVIWRNKITGLFLFWKINEEPSIDIVDESLEKAVEEEIVDEENELLDAMEDYKSEFNVKTVKTNSKKFKEFFEEWKHAE